MQFLYPQFLWALLALAIPVFIHLFYFRRYRKVLFSNVRFLREVKEETSARNKLRNLLILLMRCLALAALVFAFAQPFIPRADQVRTGIRHVSVYVDNSFSMQSFGQELPLLDRAKQRAREIIAAFGQEDRFQILTGDLSAGQQRYVNQEEAMSMIEDIDITPSVAPLSRVLNRQQALFEREFAENPLSFIISDFQRNTTNLEPVDTAIDVTLVPVQSVRQENVAIDTAWLDIPAQMLNQTVPLIVRVTNYGAHDAENVKLSMSHSGTEGPVWSQDKPLSTRNIASGASAFDTTQVSILSTGWHEVTLRITDFPVQFDNDWHLTFYVKEQVRILAINGTLPNQYLTAAFAANDHYQLDNQHIAQLNFSAMRTYDLVILNEVENITSGMTEELYQYLDTEGGNVLFFPAVNRPAGAYEGFLSRSRANPLLAYQEGEKAVGYINTEEFVFRDVFAETRGNLRLPVVRASYTTADVQRSGRERILGFRDGTSFLDKYNVGRGTLFVCSVPLHESVSDLTRNAEIFIPLLYKSAMSAGEAAPAAYIIGRDEVLEVDAGALEGDHVFRMRGATSEIIPPMRRHGARMLLSPGELIAQSGFYQLFAGDRRMGVFAYNYDRSESPMDFFSPQELTEIYGTAVSILQVPERSSMTDLITQREHGIRLWKWCIVLALVFLLLEIAVIRLWKV